VIRIVENYGVLGIKIIGLLRKLWINFMIFFGEVGVRMRNIRLDFETDQDPHLHPRSIFHLFITERFGVLGIAFDKN